MQWNYIKQGFQRQTGLQADLYDIFVQFLATAIDQVTRLIHIAEMAFFYRYIEPYIACRRLFWSYSSLSSPFSTYYYTVDSKCNNNLRKGRNKTREYKGVSNSRATLLVTKTFPPFSRPPHLFATILPNVTL